MSKISAQVRADQPNAQPPRYFRATVESFDPFVTGKPLTLNLEMMQWQAAQLFWVNSVCTATVSPVRLVEPSPPLP